MCGHTAGGPCGLAAASLGLGPAGTSAKPGARLGGSSGTTRIPGGGRAGIPGESAHNRVWCGALSNG